MFGRNFIEGLEGEIMILRGNWVVLGAKNRTFWCLENRACNLQNILI